MSIGERVAGGAFQIMTVHVDRHRIDLVSGSIAGDFT
jgi:hypothetical protein